MSGSNATASNALPQDQPGSDQRSHEPSMEEILASIRRIISDDQMLPLSPRASVPPLPPANATAAPSSRADPPAVKSEPEPARPITIDRHDELDDVLDLAEVAHGDREIAAADEVAHRIEPLSPPPPPLRVQPEPVTAQREDPPAGPNSPPPPPLRAQPEPVIAQREDPPVRPSSPPPPPQLEIPAPASRATDDGHLQPHVPLVSETTVSAVSSSFHQLAATMLMQNFPPVDQIARELLRPMIKTWLDDNLPVMVERLVRAEIERVARVGR